jgi:tRNA threonylcarbamoyl adenosine modification protein YjeE
MKPLVFPLKAEPIYSESELLDLGEEMGRALRPGDRVLLEGEMGAGKSTFARAILKGFGVSREGEGSPTFPIAHEYSNHSGQKILHVDFYRLKSEAEIEATGLTEAFWDRSLVILSEWTRQFGEFYQAIQDSPDLRTIEVRIEIENESLRRLKLISVLA